MGHRVKFYHSFSIISVILLSCGFILVLVRLSSLYLLVGSFDFSEFCIYSWVSDVISCSFSVIFTAAETTSRNDEAHKWRRVKNGETEINWEKTMSSSTSLFLQLI